jgi:hypothetical protein
MGLSRSWAVLLVLVCAAIGHVSATRHLMQGNSDHNAAQVLSKLSALFTAIANTAISTSIVSWFALLVQVFPRLARLKPAVNALAVPPGPPLLSTVDPTALLYVPLTHP